MDVLSKILRDVPLFRHCSDSEIETLRGMGRLSAIRKGQLFDLKKLRSFNIVVDGIFEIEALGKTDIVYLAPGSFFGNIPFTDNRLKGTIRAIMDSTLLLFELEDLYRFFLMSFKSLRGYLTVIKRMGYGISDFGAGYFKDSTKVISVYGMKSGSGKSLLASILGTGLSGDGRVIILDLSYEGYSLFRYFQRETAPPVSQRMDDSAAMEKIINERMERVTENLHLLNVAFGARVKVDGDILAPLLFILSKEYRYVIMDVSGRDIDLRNRAFDVSDIVMSVMKGKKEMTELHGIHDTALRDGQRAFHVLNGFHSRKARSFSGGLIMEDFRKQAEDITFEDLNRFADTSLVQDMIGHLSGKRKALVLETNFLESVFLSGFFSTLKRTGTEFDLIYTSSLAMFPLVHYLLSEGEEEYRRQVSRFYGEERFNSLLDISFPSEYVFKNNDISRYCADIAGDLRMESFATLPVVQLTGAGGGEMRLFSTGFLRETASASFLVYPLFEPVEIQGEGYHSGYPGRSVSVEDLYRTDVDEIVYVSVDAKDPVRYGGDRLIPFYSRYVEMMWQRRQDDKISELADENIVLTVNEKEMKIEKIMEMTASMTNKLLKEKKIIE